jgi:amino acid transporter
MRPASITVRIGRDGVDDHARGGTLGTFAGVFTPSILTILGIILFLRLGYVVGNSGLRNALVMIGIASAVSALTSISLAAIATNIDVRGGGDYYMISRTLGVEFGGAIGIVLFLAQSVSIAFYAMGFGEAVAAMTGWSWSGAPQVIAATATIVLFAFAWLGADVASKFQFVVMTLLVWALVSFYTGAIPSFSTATLTSDMGPPVGAIGFWAAFAILFPAVTGFTQGVSMSGDLRDPGRSLPRGTFAAVGVSTVVYVSVAILLAGSRPLASLAEDTSALRSVALVGPLIDLGVIAATLSSAMASFLGAPRILQSLAADRVFPVLGVFARGHGPANNPRRGVLFSLAIAITTIGLGSLNAIAPVVSMFFLISYGLLNYATYYEAQAASPSFRPRFRFFDKRLSLLGALGCLGVMVAINPVAGIGAVAVLVAIHQYLRRSERPERWADASRSHYFQRAKESIRSMTAEADHARNWRPQVLAFSADPLRRERLLRFATWLEGRSGLTAAVRIMVGDGAIARLEREKAQRALDQQMDRLGLDVHCRVVLAPDTMEALPVIVQSFGLGPLRANTVLFGWPEEFDADRLGGYVQAIRAVMRLGVNVVSMSSDEHRWAALEALPARDRRIDVWWEDDDSSNLALLVAYLFTRTAPWRRARIRLVARVAEAADAADRLAELHEMLEEVRIHARPYVLTAPTLDDVVAACTGAAIVLLPMRVRRGEILDPLGGRLDDVLRRLPMTAGVLAGAPVDLAAGPDTRHHTALTAAEERVETARHRLRSLEGHLADLEQEVAVLRMDAARPDDGEAPARLREREEQMQTVLRRTLKARAKLDAATADLSAILERGPSL